MIQTDGLLILTENLYLLIYKKIVVVL